MKRLVKKQLKEDELLTGFNKFIRFAKKWAREVMLFGIVVLVGLLLFSGFKFIKSQNLKKESRTVGQILALRAELNKNPGNAAKLEQLAGTQKFSRMVYTLLATYWIEQGDWDKAQAALEKINPVPKDLFYYQAQDLQAQIYMLRANYDRAIEILKKIEEEKPREYTLDVVLYHQAEALEKKGASKEALALYKRIQDEFPQTYYGYDASQKVKKLEGGQ